MAKLRLLKGFLIGLLLIGALLIGLFFLFNFVLILLVVGLVVAIIRYLYRILNKLKKDRLKDIIDVMKVRENVPPHFVTQKEISVPFRVQYKVKKSHGKISRTH